MWAPKLRTPGIARSSMLAWVVMRTISGCEALGVVSQCMRKSRSLNEGSSDWPSPEAPATPARTTVPAVGPRRARLGDDPGQDRL